MAESLSEWLHVWKFCWFCPSLLLLLFLMVLAGAVEHVHRAETLFNSRRSEHNELVRSAAIICL